MNARRPASPGSDVRNKADHPEGAPGDAPARHRLPRTRRITSNREIRALFLRGKRSRTAHLDVFHAVSLSSHPRVGAVVPKHRRTAVERNRLKRRLREVLRAEVLPRLRAANARADVLVRARREAYLATFPQLRDELIAWVDSGWSRAS